MLTRGGKRTRTAAAGLALVATSLAMPANATTSVAVGGRFVVLAQAMVPRTGMMDAQQPMPMKERSVQRSIALSPRYGVKKSWW
jgi:hypothetical protein